MSRVVDLWHRKDRTRTTRYGKGQRWQAVRTDGAGRETKRSFDTKDAAKAWASASAEGRTKVRTDTVLFRDYAAQYSAAAVHQAGSTRDNQKSHLKAILPALGDKELGEITRADVQDLVVGWTSRYAASTIRPYLGTLRAILNAAVLDDLIPKSPVLKISLPKLPPSTFHPLSVERAQLVANAMDEPFRSMAVVAAATGLRPAELRGLTTGVVNLRKSRLEVGKQLARAAHQSGIFTDLKTTPSHRTVDFGQATAEVLEPLLADPGEEGLVFHYKGGRITHQRVQAAWGAVRKKMPDIGDGWHQFRHHHASVLLSSGASVVAVARRLGHKDATETLKTYGHLMPEDASRLVDLTDGLVKLDRHKTATDNPEPA